MTEILWYITYSLILCFDIVSIEGIRNWQFCHILLTCVSHSHTIGLTTAEILVCHYKLLYCKLLPIPYIQILSTQLLNILCTSQLYIVQTTLEQSNTTSACTEYRTFHTTSSGTKTGLTSTQPSVTQSVLHYYKIRTPCAFKIDQYCNTIILCYVQVIRS